MIKEKVKVAVLVSGGGSNLQAIIDGVRSGEVKNCEISAVISSKPDVYALERARKYGIPAFTVNRKEHSDSEEFCEEIDKLITKVGAKLIVLGGFLSVLTLKFTEKYENRIINVHPALIPSFCGKGFYGLRVHEEALKYGVKVSGATVHFVSSEVDGGAIILQKAVDVLEGDTPEILQKRIMEQAEWVILPRAVHLFCNGILHIDGRKVTIKGE